MTTTLPENLPALSHIRRSRLQRAVEIVAAIRAHVDDYTARRIDGDTFSTRARETWGPANEDRHLLALTGAVLRGDWPDAVALTDYRNGPRCSRWVR